MRTAAYLKRLLKLEFILMPILVVVLTAVYNTITTRETCALDVRIVNLEESFVKSENKWLYWYKEPARLKKYFAEKYKKQITDISSDIRDTPRGPRGYLNLGGHISNYTSQADSGDRAARSRIIAKAFLAEEAEMLGLPDVNELRELPRSDTLMGYGGEYTHLYYMRYLGGLPIENSYVHITIGPDETIFHVSVSLVPSPSEMYEAVGQKTIAEDVARRIIEKDAMRKSADIKKSTFLLGEVEIVAIASAPYAVWKGSVSFGGGRRWMYELDAFTGKIDKLQKLMISDPGC